MTGPDAETIGAVASLLRVSVRALRHWDALGIASPSSRTPGGYRSYSPADVARLRRVLLFRELGVPLARIPALLAARAAERREVLTSRRGELDARIRHLERVRQDVDRLLAADEAGVLLTDVERSDVFGETWDPAWSEGARDRWADSAQWAEYAERSAKRTVEDWRNVTASVQAVIDALAQAKREQVAPGSARADALAERHRAAISEYFHCTLSMQVLMARMYVTETGFAEFYDRTEPGLVAWMKQVIDANARRNGVDPETATWA
jgi:DNA-binding transcriptional MerR regulator